MVSSENTVQKTVYFLESDFEFLNGLHNDNLNEAVRIALRKLRRHGSQTVVLQYIQLVTLGIISLGISGLIQPLNTVGIFLLVIGCGLCILGIIGLLTVVVKRKRMVIKKYDVDS